MTNKAKKVAAKTEELFEKRRRTEEECAARLEALRVEIEEASAEKERAENEIDVDAALAAEKRIEKAKKEIELINDKVLPSVLVNNIISEEESDKYIQSLYDYKQELNDDLFDFMYNTIKPQMEKKIQEYTALSDELFDVGEVWIRDIHRNYLNYNRRDRLNNPVRLWYSFSERPGQSGIRTLSENFLAYLNQMAKERGLTDAEGDA